jgi:hypothetical protein
VRGVGRGRFQRGHHHVLDLLGGHRHGPARPWVVDQPVAAPLDEPAPPLADRGLRHPLPRCDLVRQALGAAQHDPRPQRQRLRGRPPLRRDHCDERPRQPAGHRVSPPRLGVHRRAQQADGASVGEPRAGPRPVDADVSRRAESDSSRPRLAPNCSRPTAECPTISPPSRCKAPLRSPQYEAEGAPRPEPTTTRGT